MSDDDLLAEARADVQADREPLEFYDPGGHDGPYGYELADIEVVPDSLSDFGDLLFEDSNIFIAKVGDDFGVLFAEFTSFGGVVEDGAHLEENYSNALKSMQSLMTDVGLGLTALAGAAKYVLASYLDGDWSAVGRLDEAWDDIDVDTVGMAFSRQESWPDISQNPEADRVRQAEEEFAALRGRGGDMFTPLDEDGRSNRPGGGLADPAIEAAQDGAWDQIRTDIESANRADEHPFLDESDSPGWPYQEDYDEWGAPYSTDFPIGHPDREDE